ncbi:MAG: HIT domain-containing protein [archaeon]|nr:HIT domain-containing protein [archaeon]
MLTSNEIIEVKRQLLEQIETFPEDKKILARQQIEEMTDDELEEFLKRNNLMKHQKCIFCSIANGDIPSLKIMENDNAIAVLEINPISEGHVLIIPKEHEHKISENEISLAKKVGERIKENLNPRDVIIAKSSLMDHEILNVIPAYKDETINSERKKMSQSELAEIQEKLQIQKEKKPEPKEEPKVEKKLLKEEKIRLPRRIP